MTPGQRSRKFSPAQRRTFAYHEAGHAVAIHVLGYAFVAVEIYDRPVDKEAGAIVRDTLQDEILLIHDMVISYAGPLAQCRRLKCGKLNAIVVREGSQDFNHADKCATSSRRCTPELRASSSWVRPWPSPKNSSSGAGLTSRLSPRR
jgi:hypothetical protein